VLPVALLNQAPPRQRLAMPSAPAFLPAQPWHDVLAHWGMLREALALAGGRLLHSESSSEFWRELLVQLPRCVVGIAADPVWQATAGGGTGGGPAADRAAAPAALAAALLLLFWAAADALGLLLYIGGSLLEVVADLQKLRFKADPANQGRCGGVGWGGVRCDVAECLAGQLDDLAGWPARRNVWAAAVGVECASGSAAPYLPRRQAASDCPPVPHTHRFICSGVWRFSQHPNYFGEMCLWWGVYLVCLPGLAQDPRRALLGLLGPVSVVLLLRFASGVPPLDAAAERRWGRSQEWREWREYRRRTSLLVPWPRKEERLNAKLE
jgi:hypothetical protein